MDKKIVLYSAANTHGDICCLIHKLLYNRDSYAIYIGASSQTRGLEFYDKHLVYKQIGGTWGNMEYLSPDEYEKYVVNFFDSELKKMGIKLSDVSEFFIGSNWADFPIYLNIKGIKFNVFEEGVGSLGIPAENWKPKYNKFYVAEKYGVFKGIENDNIIKAYVHPKTLSKDSSKYIEFDVEKELSKLSVDDRNLVRESYGVPRAIKISRRKILLLTQWFNINGQMWKDFDIVKMYSLLIDFFAGKESASITEIIVKPHPVDPMKEVYSKYLSNCTVIDTSFPSELFGSIEDSRVDMALTVSSTSINTVTAVSAQQLSIKYFEHFFNVTPQVYICLQIIKRLNYKCFHFGFFNEVMLPLLSANAGDLPSNSVWYRIDNNPLTEVGGIILYDYVWRTGVSHTSLSTLSKCPAGSFCFIITDNLSNLIKTPEDVILVDHLYKMSISIIPYHNYSTFKIEENKIIYLFCMDEKLIDCINGIKLLSVLPCSKILLKKNDFCKTDEFNKIKINYIINNIKD